jgi:ATP-binding cassette subfamily F protein uup
METFFKDYQGTLLFITHDRSFLQTIATRIIEIDRGQLRDFPCTYPEYLERKQQQLDAEAQANCAFRQEAGTGGGLDTAGHQGPSYAQ